jgi:hypothetical protein
LIVEKRKVDFRGETNTSDLLAFLDETEGLLQQLINRDKQLQELELKVCERLNFTLTVLVF